MDYTQNPRYAHAYTYTRKRHATRMLGIHGYAMQTITKNAYANSPWMLLGQTPRHANGHANGFYFTLCKIYYYYSKKEVFLTAMQTFYR